MTDSQTPDPADGETTDRDSSDPTPDRGFFGELEYGIGALFGAFEKGALDIAEAEGKKRRGDTGIDAADSGADEPATDRADTNPAETSATEPKVREPRPGMTYDEVLDGSPGRIKKFVLGLVVAVVLAALYWLTTLWQVWAASDDDAGTRVDAIELIGAADYDAIAVLGAAQFDGTPSPVLQARLDHALDLWNRDLAPVIVTTGSNQEGDRFTEGFSGFVYLRENGVPEDAILAIIDGDDTYTQMTATLNEMERRELENVLLVSDGFHSYRLLQIAEEIGLDAYVSPTGVEATRDDWVRETTAVSIGRIFGYRRLSAWG